MKTMQDVTNIGTPHEQRERRWHRTGPLELRKELEQMKVSRVAPYIIAHLEAHIASRPGQFSDEYRQNGGLQTA